MVPLRPEICQQQIHNPAVTLHAVLLTVGAQIRIVNRLRYFRQRAFKLPPVFTVCGKVGPYMVAQATHYAAVLVAVYAV